MNLLIPVGLALLWNRSKKAKRKQAEGSVAPTSPKRRRRRGRARKSSQPQPPTTSFADAVRRGPRPHQARESLPGWFRPQVSRLGRQPKVADPKPREAEPPKAPEVASAPEGVEPALAERTLADQASDAAALRRSEVAAAETEPAHEAAAEPAHESAAEVEPAHEAAAEAPKARRGKRGGKKKSPTEPAGK